MKKWAVFVVLMVVVVSLFLLKTRTAAVFPVQSYCNVHFVNPVYEFKDSSGNSLFVLDEHGNLYINSTKVLLNQNTVSKPVHGFGLRVNSIFFAGFNNSLAELKGEILQKQEIPDTISSNEILFRNPVTKEPLAMLDSNGNLLIKGLAVYNSYYNGLSPDVNAFNSNCSQKDNYNSSTGITYWQDYYCDRKECHYRNVDLDSSELLCKSGNFFWDIGGNINATVCCGDDPGEYKITKQCNSGCTSDATDDACCDNSEDAVNGSTCYSPGSEICSPNDNKLVIKADTSGKWDLEYNCTKECADSCNLHTSCYEGNCVGSLNVPLGEHCVSGSGAVAGLCNTSYACSNSSGSMIYNDGGHFNCTATCNGTGGCNYATNCIDCSQPGDVNGCACACGGYGVPEDTAHHNCDDGIDNDCDGKTDIQDSGCLKLDGSPCTSNEECESQYCVDGVCCNSACDGACESCNQEGYEGTCEPLPAGTVDSLCGPCKVCDGSEMGTCSKNAPNTHWGDNLYGCDGTNARCYSGSCVTCGGWLYDDGCSGCAGQGGKGCWYRGGEDQSCTTVCSSHGGCVNANWDDSTSCSVCTHFVPSYTSCGASGESGNPKIWNNQECSYRSDSYDQICGATPGGARTRFCICNY